ncbi:hypothetical protein ACP70R_030136 [Stipagrostis hirtigluma subsp. patula]
MARGRLLSREWRALGADAGELCRRGAVHAPTVCSSSPVMGRVAGPGSSLSRGGVEAGGIVGDKSGGVPSSSSSDLETIDGGTRAKGEEEQREQGRRRLPSVQVVVASIMGKLAAPGVVFTLRFFSPFNLGDHGGCGESGLGFFLLGWIFSVVLHAEDGEGAAAAIKMNFS